MTTYSFAFTAGSLLAAESIRAAEALVGRRGDWGKVREAAVRDNLLQKTQPKARSRIFLEIQRRLTCLSADEIELLVRSRANVQIPLLLAGVCRAYGFVRDLIVDVLAANQLRLQATVRHSDLQAFLDHMEIAHPEFGGLRPSTKKKVREVALRILTEAGLLTRAPERRIVPLLLPPALARHFAANHPEDLPLFLLGEAEVVRLIRAHGRLPA